MGDDFTGDIAIDDLSFLGCEPYDGKCDNETTTHSCIINTLCVCLCVCGYIFGSFILLYLCLGVLPSLEASTMAPPVTYPTLLPHSCPLGQFVCGAYGECVSQNQVCDFRRDCSDGSDEKGCGMSVLIFISIYQSLHPDPFSHIHLFSLALKTSQ